MAEPELRRRLEPISVDVIKWSLQRIAALCREHGVPAVALVIPRTNATPEDPQELAKLTAWAKSAGFSVLNLEGVFDGQVLDSIQVSSKDDHPNARGHRLIADRLFEQLRESDRRVLKLGPILTQF